MVHPSSKELYFFFGTGKGIEIMSWYETQVGLELIQCCLELNILLPPSPKCWDYKHVLPCPWTKLYFKCSIPCSHGYYVRDCRATAHSKALEMFHTVKISFCWCMGLPGDKNHAPFGEELWSVPGRIDASYLIQWWEHHNRVYSPGSFACHCGSSVGTHTWTGRAEADSSEKCQWLISATSAMATCYRGLQIHVWWWDKPSRAATGLQTSWQQEPAAGLRPSLGKALLIQVWAERKHRRGSCHTAGLGESCESRHANHAWKIHRTELGCECSHVGSHWLTCPSQAGDRNAARLIGGIRLTSEWSGWLLRDGRECTTFGNDPKLRMMDWLETRTEWARLGDSSTYSISEEHAWALYPVFNTEPFY